MTTKNPETLDPTLISPGRIDMQIFFGTCSAESAELIPVRMYRKDADEYDLAEQMVNEATHNNQLSAAAG